MVTQYPHTATVTIYTDPVTLPNGDIEPGTSSTSSFKCRLEPASRGGYVKAQDGTRIDFSWVVYCKKNTGILPVGAQVEVKDDQDRTLCLDTVKQFSQGQLNSRVWL